MRILFCNKYNFRFSGTEAYLFDLMQLLRDAGHSVALFSMTDTRGDVTPYDHLFVRHVDFRGVQHSPLEAMKLASHAIYCQEARAKLRRLIHEFKPDVAHIRNIYHHLSPSVFWELKKQHVPVIYHLNDFKLLCPNYNFVANGTICERCQNGRFYNIVRSGCYPGGRAAGAVLAAEAYLHHWFKTYETCVDCFLVPSQFVRAKLVEYGWSSSRIQVLPHFQRVPETLSPEVGRFAPVLYFGRLSAEKGLKDLFSAAQTIPQIPFEIAGEGPQRAELEQICHQSRLRNVRFLGQLSGPQLEKQISQSAFTVLPSHAYETLGKSILESYAWGRAVVASDLGSRREFVDPGRTGLLFPPGDAPKLAASIALLYAFPAIAGEMGKAGRDFLRRFHSPGQHRDALIRLYHSLGESRSQLSIAKPSNGRRNVRVAFIGGRGVVSKYSGIEAYYEEVGRRLAQHGHQVTVYCRPHFTPAVATYNGMRIVRVPTWRTKHMETLIHTALSTLHAMGQDFDVVHYHALGPALFSFLPRLAGERTAVTVQGLDWQRKKWGGFASYVLRLGERAAIRFPNSTMVVSRSLQEHYRADFNSLATYIANGARVRERKAPQFLHEWGLQPEKYALYLGRFSPEKNCHLLIEAFERIDTTVKLVLAGGASYADEYSRALTSHKSERILFLDYVSGERLDELLTNAMLFVLPSDMEGLSLALLEAMGSGLCVLTSDIPENRELVDGVGFTFRRGDSRDLERMLRILLADDGMRARAGRLARKRIAEKYSWDAITRQIEDAYFKTLDVQVPQPARRPARGILASSANQDRVA